MLNGLTVHFRGWGGVMWSSFFQDWERVPLTWAYLAVVPHPIRLHDTLKSRCELVGPQQSGWSVGAWDAIHEGRHGGITFSLQKRNHH